MFGPRLFVSYRRADSAASARALFEALKSRFGARRVFLDTSDIPYGEDFREVIRKEIARSDVVLVVIGTQWLNASNDKGPRLQQPDDPVRFEIEAALSPKRRIVPVLIDGAVPPAESALPESIRALSVLDMAPLRNETFDIDFNALVNQLYGRMPDDVGDELDLWYRIKAIAVAWPFATAAIALVTLLVAWSGALDVLHLDTHVQRLLLAAEAPNAGEPVLLVGIDAASESALKRAFGPADTAAAWRRDHARLIDRAARAGASAVVFDIFFERSTEADDELAAAARRAAGSTPPTRVIFGARQLEGEAPDLRVPLRQAGQWGSLCLIDRGGGALWSTPIAIAPRDAVRSGELTTAMYPSLALAALVGEPLQAADVSRRVLQFDGPLRATPVRFSGVEPIRLDGRCRIARAGDDQLTLLLRVAPAGHWRDPSRQVSYADALDPMRVADQRFKDRVVLVGATALQKQHDDIHVVREGIASRQVFGVELQADAIATLASDRVPRLPTVDLQLVTTLMASVVGAAAALLLYRWPAWWRRAALLALALAWALIAWGLATRDIILNPAHDVIAMLLSYLALRAAQWAAQTFHRLRRPST
ncbi:MAG: CHASE2 domain-containing protein [Burkholderiaceae bacterium]